MPGSVDEPANDPAMVPTADDRKRLWTLEEIAYLTAHTSDPADTLANIVRVIQQRFATDVCSVYLLEPDRSHLILASTIGLRPESVGRVRMALNEGLVGLVAEQLAPQLFEDATAHPRFKYFVETGEDAFRSFLGVPVLDRGTLVGVLVVQTTARRAFGAEDVRLLAIAGAQVAPVLAAARAIGHFIAPAHQRLREIARNLWWSWDAETTSLFREIDPVLWRACGHNPITLLDSIPIERLEERALQMALHGRISYAYRRMQEYLHSTRTWGGRHAGVLWARPVAYFSAEFGLHESIPIYSGGLGVLAGDHMKSASDLGVPLVGVGLYYDQGYFRQRIDADGWQREDYLALDHRVLPLEPALGTDGSPATVAIETEGGTLRARVWRLAVGRNTLLLLDSNVEGNTPEDRGLTARLYGGDHRVRIRQELLLGVGGMRALSALGIRPGVVHLNEGHSAFASLELVRLRMRAEGIDAAEAMRRVAASIVFTTHTPVPAGHDRFPARLVEEHLGPLRQAIGLDAESFVGLGRAAPQDPDEPFCMTVLALKLSRRANAVSSLHGEVSRAMWHGLFASSRGGPAPIGHVTNGVHIHTWLAPHMRLLFDRHLGAGWAEQSSDPATWEAIDQVDDGELWEAHQASKVRMIDVVRRRASAEAARRGDPEPFVADQRRALSPDSLTIGFARRFATYKRADLVFREFEAMASLVDHPHVPVRLVFAGKAHPRDDEGKAILQGIVRLLRGPRLVGKVVFLEDYDINVGRFLVQGVDVWLNNPRRPLEACGTSGQKVLLNGGLNLSILDGWWAEAFDGSNGFAIGSGETHASVDVHDARDADNLLQALRDEVVPMYYERDRDGLPRRWIGRMKRAIRTLGWRFNADRMVRDYVRQAYIPAAGGTSSAGPPEW